MNFCSMLASIGRARLSVGSCAVVVATALLGLILLGENASLRAAEPSAGGTVVAADANSATGPAQAETGEASTVKPATCATASAFHVRKQDTVWLISTRHLDCEPCRFAPQVFLYDNCRWVPSTLEAFYKSDVETVDDPVSGAKACRYTTAWVHGNRIDDAQAQGDGLRFYFELAGRIEKAPPVRHIIWSWPSTQQRGPIRDVRSKAARADVESVYLGTLLGGMHPKTQLRIVGYSYGGRIVTGAMHMLGNGTWMGHALPDGERPNARVCLWVAGEHCHWLLPGHAHGNALSAADNWLSLYNHCDEVLWRFPKLDPCDSSSALGFRGLANSQSLPEDLAMKWEEWSVNHLIGSEHNMRLYWNSQEIISRTRKHLFAAMPPEIEAMAQKNRLQQANLLKARQLQTSQLQTRPLPAQDGLILSPVVK